MDIRSLKPASDFDNAGIYCIGNIINNKVYIGSAINVKQRIRNHRKYLMGNKHPNKHLQSAWNKCSTDFLFYLIEIVDDETMLLDREKYYIKLYNATDNTKGYNRRSIPNSNLGLKLHSEEYKINLSERMKGHTYNNGKITSEETKKKLSIALKGRKHSKEHIEKRIAYKRGKPISNEQKAKISKKLKGNKCAQKYKNLIFSKPTIIL